LLNPVTIAYFSALILGRGVGSATSVGERAAFVIGAALASLSWQTFLAGAGSLAKRRLSPSFQTLTSVLGNLVVIGLGVRILIQLFD
jgi:arginine exporter protein ArgO